MNHMLVIDVMFTDGCLSSKEFHNFKQKVFDYRCYVFDMSKNDAINLLNDSWLDNKGVL